MNFKTSDPALEYLVNTIGQSLFDIQTTSDVLGFTVETQAHMAAEAIKEYGLTAEEYREQLRAQYPEIYSLVKPRDYTDTGNAEIVERRNRGTMIFCDSLGWMVYDSTRGVWEPSEHAAKDRCRDYTNHLLAVAQDEYFSAYDNALSEKITKDKEIGKDSGKVKDPPEKALYNHALKSRSAYALKAMLEVCKTRLHGKASMFDAAPYDLNTPAGIVDLRTGEIRPHDPEAYCTHQTACTPSDQGKQLWFDFLELITSGDKDLQRYLQLNAGMSAIGEIAQEYALFSIGGGRNGKSTFYGAYTTVMGDYAGTISSEAITKQKHENRFALAGIRGKRLVVCGELEQGTTLSTKNLKAICSAQDPMQLEMKYKDAEQVPRTFHLHMFSNYLPKVDTMDLGTWRRMQVIPFNATMPEGKNEIVNYGMYLAEHAGGAILQWVIDGAVAYYKNKRHIEIPAAVKQATDRYQAAEDWLAPFIEDCCITGTMERVSVGNLRNAWGRYAATNNLVRRTNAELDDAMENKGYHKRKSTGGIFFWYGIGIKASDHPGF